VRDKLIRIAGVNSSDKMVLSECVGLDVQNFGMVEFWFLLSPMCENWLNASL
jgi:hypothetical protein